VRRVADGTVYIDLLEQYIFNAITERLADYQTLSDYTNNEVKPKVHENSLQIAKIEKEISELLLKVAYATPALMEYINQRVQQLDEQCKKLQQENLTTLQAVKTNKFNTVYDHAKNWENTSFEDKQSVVDILINIIYISNDEIKITWNC
jgi:hypothetical protein